MCQLLSAPEQRQSSEHRQSRISIIFTKEQQKRKTFYLNLKENFSVSKAWGVPTFIPKELVYEEGSEFMSKEPRSMTFGANIYYRKKCK